LTKPPEELIAPKYFKDGIMTSTNVTGKYRPCEEANCETYINCPYMRCNEHWYGMIDKSLTNMKEWKE
jgi:hypothetical protein